MLRIELGARDNPRLAECWQPHGLCAIELRVLERCQTNKLRNQSRREFFPVNVNLIGKHYPDAAWYRGLNALRRGAARRRHLPRLVGMFVVHRHANAQNST